MQKHIRFLTVIVILPLGLILNACAGRPRSRVEMGVPGLSTALPVENALAYERLTQRVKQNGKDIKKYFILDEDGQILIKADLQDETGAYEVSYKLDSAEILPDSSYRVNFNIGRRNPALPDSGEEPAGLDIIAEDALIWRPGPGSEGLLLAMDDDYIETWEQYFDFFDECGARITFFIQGEYFPFSVKALSRGHDIGFHTLNHLDLRKVSREEFAEETYEAAESFRQEGIPLSSFAYPFGFSEPWMHKILLESFGVLRGYGTTYRLYNEDQIRSGYIISRAIDNTVIQGEENFNLLISLMLRTLKFLDDGRILPLTTHDISDDAYWGISLRRLEFLLKTAAELKLKFYRYSDFAEMAK